MEPTDLPADAMASIRMVILEEGLDASQIAFVARHVHADDATWRWCCGSHCDPCVQRLGRAVDRARSILAGRDAPHVPPPRLTPPGA